MENLAWIAVVITALMCTGLALGMLVLNALLGPKRISEQKSSPFECGSVPADNPRKRVFVQFYAVALVFVIFDIEAVFLFPWAVLYRDLLGSPLFGPIALAEFLVFIGVLALGLWYIFGKGVLDWGREQR